MPSLPRISNGSQSATVGSRRRPGSGGDSKKKPTPRLSNTGMLYDTFSVETFGGECIAVAIEQYSLYLLPKCRLLATK